MTHSVQNRCAPGSISMAVLPDENTASSSNVSLPVSPFSTKSQIPSSRSTNPWPPASTTPACFKTGSSSGVWASDSLALTRPYSSISRISLTPCRDLLSSAMEKSSSTVGSVPATGSDMAVHAAFAPALLAVASASAVIKGLSSMASLKP